MTDQRPKEQAEPEQDSMPEEKRVIGLEEAGENFGVEDTPYNAPEEVEAQKRNRSGSE
jgi:hypothetical protein